MSGGPGAEVGAADGVVAADVGVFEIPVVPVAGVAGVVVGVGAVLAVDAVAEEELVDIDDANEGEALREGADLFIPRGEVREAGGPARKGADEAEERRDILDVADAVGGVVYCLDVDFEAGGEAALEFAQQLFEPRGEELAVAGEIFGGRAVERAIARVTAAVVVDKVDAASGEDDEGGRVEGLELALVGADGLHVHGGGGGVLREIEVLDLGVDLFQIELQGVVGDLTEEQGEEPPALGAEAGDHAIADAEEPDFVRREDAGKRRARDIDGHGAASHRLESIGQPSPPGQQADAAVDEHAFADLPPEPGVGHWWP